MMSGHSRLMNMVNFLAAALFVGLGLGCSQNMDDVPRVEPLEPSVVFANGTSARRPVPGTIAQGELQLNIPFSTGRRNGELLTTFPDAILQQWNSAELLARGRERFDIFCATCHDRVGSGNGMVVQRGFPQPPTYHSDRLRRLPIGHFFEVITNGFGRMPSYAEQIPVEDRWAIAGYVRALQFSQYASLNELPQDLQETVQSKSP